MNLIKCSAKAMSLCPDVKACCSQRHPAEFVEGSECHKYNEEVESLFTNADYIRSMTDEELEEVIRRTAVGYEPWCDHHCTMNGDDNCNVCLAKWLKQPKENNNG